MRWHKKREICYCGGDKSKCDFYENVRIKAKLEQKSNEIIKVDGEPSNMIEGLYKIIDRSLKDSSVKSVEVEVKDFMQLKINRQEGEKND